MTRGDPSNTARESAIRRCTAQEGMRNKATATCFKTSDLDRISKGKRGTAEYTWKCPRTIVACTAGEEFEAEEVRDKYSYQLMRAPHRVHLLVESSLLGAGCQGSVTMN
jgi:hypothetical protein